MCFNSETMKFLTFLYTFLIVCLHSSSATTNYNVLSFGAKGDGVTDSTQAFLNAWAAACSSTESTTIYVPEGTYLLGSSVAFKGDCKSSDITILIDGTLVAPLDYNVLGESDNWLSFEGVDNVSIVGGTVNANGSALWACKAASYNCPTGATTLSFTNSNNIRINGVSSLNSQMFHIVINGCQDIHIEEVNVTAASDSPNTDGIHVQYSRNVMITNSSIQTGDDCISIGPGTKNLWIESITCGPGHGISIGSLGKDMDEQGVENVTVQKTFFKGTQNGFRIKSWARPSNGFVEGVRFINATIQNVQNPIVIDQNYCPHKLNCPLQVSGVRIRDVMYQDIEGTSATAVAIKFDCSTLYPCTEVRLQNVNLTYLNHVAQSSCNNVIGETLGLVQPNTCL